jgi:hypothetical protein
MSEQQPQQTTGKGVAVLAGIGIVLIASGLGSLWYFQDNIARAFEGPLKVSPEELARLSSPADLPMRWIKFKTTKVVPTGVEKVRPDFSKKHVLHKYYLVQVSDRWLVAALKPNFKGNVIVGELLDKPGQGVLVNRVEQQAWSKVTAATTAIHQGRLLPFQLSDLVDWGEDWQYGVYLFAGMAGVGLLFLLGALWSLLTSRESATRAPASAVPPGNPDLQRVFSWPK